MKEFKNIKTQLKYEQWINNSPESYNGFDMDRFYDFVLSLKQSQDWITEEELKSSFNEVKKLDSEFRDRIVNDYFRRYQEISGFIDFMTEKNLIKIQN